MKTPSDSQGRQRHHLSIALGDGPRGAEVRRAIELAAEREGVKVSAWCRRVLTDEAKSTESGFATRGEFEALAARVGELEDVLNLSPRAARVGSASRA